MKRIHSKRIVGFAAMVLTVSACQTLDPYTQESKTSNAAKGAIDDAAKPKIAADITRIHCDVTGAPPMSLGAVNVPAFLVVITMTMVTAPLGAKIAHALDPKPLKRVFGVFLTLVALNMLQLMMDSGIIWQ